MVIISTITLLLVLFLSHYIISKSFVYILSLLLFYLGEALFHPSLSNHDLIMNLNKKIVSFSCLCIGHSFLPSIPINYSQITTLFALYIAPRLFMIFLICYLVTFLIPLTSSPFYTSQLTHFNYQSIFLSHLYPVIFFINQSGLVIFLICILLYFLLYSVIVKIKCFSTVSILKNV